MLLSFTKYFFIILCCFYLSRKLLCVSSNKIEYLIELCTSVPLAFISLYTKQYINTLNVFITLLLLTSFIIIRHKFSIRTSIPTATISFGLSYFVFIFSVLLTTPIKITFLYFSFSGLFSDFLLYLIGGIIQILLIRIPFTSKRLKNGMPFLKHGRFEDIGFLISILLSLTIVFFTATPSIQIKLFVCLPLILTCGLLLFVWWFKRLKTSYIEKLRVKEIESLKFEIQQLRDEVENLRQNNNDLSKLIHKDNKLIPAMENVVKTLAASAVFPDESTNKQAQDLLETLHSISKERSGILTTYESTYKQTTQTGVISIDAICHYIEQRSAAQKTVFHFAFACSVKHLTDTIIDENTLTTLIADLTENALISIKESKEKSALLSLGIENQLYVLRIYDSGTAFPPEVLCNFGLKRTTTHAKDGGSGIGLMTVYEILKKSKASFLLDETIETSTYTKVISIYFDGLFQIRIKSRRPEIMELSKVRKDFIFII